MTLYERAAQMQELLRDLTVPGGPDYWSLPRSLRERIKQALEPLPSPDSPPTAGKYPPGFVHDPGPGDVVADTGKPRDAGGHPVHGTP